MCSLKTVRRRRRKTGGVRRARWQQLWSRKWGQLQPRGPQPQLRPPFTWSVTVSTDAARASSMHSAAKSPLYPPFYWMHQTVYFCYFFFNIIVQHHSMTFILKLGWFLLCSSCLLCLQVWHSTFAVYHKKAIKIIIESTYPWIGSNVVHLGYLTHAFESSNTI